MMTSSVARLGVAPGVEGKGARRAQIGAAPPGVDGLEEEEGEAHDGKVPEAILEKMKMIHRDKGRRGSRRN